MTGFARITVTFDNGTESPTYTVEYAEGTLDKVAHRIQEEERAFWAGWKRPTGVRYQGLDASSLVDALSA